MKYTLRAGKLSLRPGHAALRASVAWVNDEVGASVCTRLVADPNGEAANYLDAGAQYCSIQYTGPTSFDLNS